MPVLRNGPAYKYCLGAIAYGRRKRWIKDGSSGSSTFVAIMTGKWLKEGLIEGQRRSEICRLGNALSMKKDVRLK